MASSFAKASTFAEASADRSAGHVRAVPLFFPWIPGRLAHKLMDWDEAVPLFFRTGRSAHRWEVLAPPPGVWTFVGAKHAP
jgi:hypothetical protein